MLRIASLIPVGKARAGPVALGKIPCAGNHLDDGVERGTTIAQTSCMISIASPRIRTSSAMKSPRSAAFTRLGARLHLARKAIERAVCLSVMCACSLPLGVSGGRDDGGRDDGGSTHTEQVEQATPAGQGSRSRPPSQGASSTQATGSARSGGRTVEPPVQTVPVAETGHEKVADIAASRQQATKPPATPAHGGWTTGFALMARGGGAHAVVGVTEDSDLLHARPRLFDRNDHIVHAAISNHDLPPYAHPWRARRVEVVTDQGARCDATVRSFHYRVDLVPDYEEELRWNGHSEDPEEQLHPLRGAPRAAAIWEAATTRTVTARLRFDDRRACLGEPLYVRQASRTPARIARPLTAVPRRAEVLHAFRSLPAYLETQAEYAHVMGHADTDRLPGAPRWDEQEREVVVQAFSFDGEQSALVSVTIPWIPCGGPDWGMWAVFRVPAEGAGRPEAITVSSRAVPDRVLLVLGGDGTELDYLIEEGAFGDVSVIRGEERLASWSREFHGCGC